MEHVAAHRDILRNLGSIGLLQDKIVELHQQLRNRFPRIHRLAIALYEPSTGKVRTYLQSNTGESPLSLYETALVEAPSLAGLMASGEARLIQDLTVFDGGTHTHTKALRLAGFASSYTLPFYWQGHPEAFIFFNSREPAAFDLERLEELDVWAHLAGMLVVTELMSVKSLMAALRTANRLIHLRDPETGGHLERMAAFSRIIARELARTGVHAFDDETIETLASFAPMHDVGKIGIPDAVLMKPGPLTDDELRVMRRHPALGRAIVNAIIEAFGADRLEHVDLLSHVTEGHHEMMDGSGYPYGLSGEQIPIASRIIAVADVFDALTSRRPYKEPWTNEEAFAYLQRQARGCLDQDCVRALIRLADEVARIQATFKE